MRIRSSRVVVIAALGLGGGAFRAGGADPTAVGGLATGSFTAELNGFKIRYEVHGRGPVLVTVPNSWGLTLEGLRALYRPLEKELTLVYFDPRGMGRSGPVREPADMGMTAIRSDFHALRRHLKLDRVAAIGWSNGAMNLIYLASERPEALSAAIFVHGVARFGPEDMKAMAEGHPELFKRFGDFQKEMRESTAPAAAKDARVKEFDVEVYFPQLFADRAAARAKLRAMYADAGFSWRHAEYVNTEIPGPFDARDRLARITARSLVIAGRHDLLPPARAEEIGKGIPGARFVVFEKSGHFAPVEEPEGFRKVVVEFLRAR
jgi:proline iminopeptidase